MALAVCLLFDVPSDRVVRQLWARLEVLGVPSPLSHTHRRHRPHLSLAVARSWELAAVQRVLAVLPPGRPLALAVQGVLAFPRGRAALAVAGGVELARRQQSVVEALLGCGTDLHHHYLPGRWVPHVSIATGGSANRLPQISTTVTDALPVTLSAVSAALIDSGTGDAWLLATLP